MKTIKKHSWIFTLITCIFVTAIISSALVSYLGRAGAAIPNTNPLYYSGLLADTSGKALTGSKNIGVDLYTGQAGGTPTCTTPAKTVTLNHGRFRMVLDKTCLNAIQKETDLWIEVLINGTALPRSKIGAVPYAVESDPQVGANTTNQVPSWNGTALVSGSIYDSGGKVGIGTTNPREKLEVADSGNIRLYYTHVGGTYSGATAIFGYNAKANTTADNVLVGATNTGGYKFISMHGNGGMQFHAVGGSVTGGKVASYERMRITESGRVGIGTKSPGNILHIHGTSPNLIIQDAGSAQGSQVQFKDNTGAQKGAIYSDAKVMTFEVGGTTELVRINSSGEVGIGTVSPSSKLHVSSGCITGTMCSDKRLKKNLRPVNSQTAMLDKVSKLKAVKYQWKNSDDDKTYFGLVAQDVEKVLPEVVSTPADGSPGMGLSCTGLNAVTIEAIKELKRLVESQQQRVKTQQIQISQMKADIARLRRAVARK